MHRNKTPIHTADCPTLQWANGKTLARSGSGRFAPFVGFHIEVGKDPDLDNLLKAARFDQVEIKHQRPGGTEIARHWNLGETCYFAPITSGPAYASVNASLKGDAAKRATAAAGIGLRWPQGERSQMALRGYVAALVEVGYLQPVQFAVRSRMTDVLFDALLDHVRICEAADGLTGRSGEQSVLLPELWLPLGPGEEEEWGKGESATVIPFRSLHPGQLSSVGLLWTGEQVVQAAWAAWDGIVEWAAEYGMKGGQADSTPTTVSEPPAAATAPAGCQPPRDAAEAERRFFARYGEIVGGSDWRHVQRYLGLGMSKPSTVEGWVEAAEMVRDRARPTP